MTKPRLRIAVTGLDGQVARALAARGPLLAVEVVPVGRPALDLTDRRTILPALRTLRPDAIVNAAAYTAVDRAEQEESKAFTINADGAGLVARAAADLDVPIVHLSTDYVFDGSGVKPWTEDDAPGPLGAYGRSKLAGEQAVRAAGPNHVVLRTAWVFSPWGQNFLRTMLRLAEDRDEVRVVADQHGSPTYALDLADAILQICVNLTEKPADASLRGVFHCAGAGFASWADVAATTFEASSIYGGPTANVIAIPSSDYPTPARRPLNSRLDTGKLRRSHGIAQPDWRNAVSRCVRDLLAPNELSGAADVAKRRQDV